LRRFWLIRPRLESQISPNKTQNKFKFHCRKKKRNSNGNLKKRYKFKKIKPSSRKCGRMAKRRVLSLSYQETLLFLLSDLVVVLVSSANEPMLEPSFVVPLPPQSDQISVTVIKKRL